MKKAVYYVSTALSLHFFCNRLSTLILSVVPFIPVDITNMHLDLCLHNDKYQILLKKNESIF